MAITGRVHSFESFGTLDGPGIRFVVFMQGCPLRCIYCHNRDTWDTAEGMEYTSDQVICELKKYLEYIRFSGGGITVSGGEPTLQTAFVSEVFEKCRSLDVHTALDTSGFADIEDVSGLLGLTDLVLLDIKHACEDKHNTITGVGTKKIRDFSQYLSNAGIPVWIRYVLVPGFTDSEEDLHAAKLIIQGMQNVQKVEVLPYHGMGEYKWQKLGVAYPLAGTGSPSAESMEKARRILAGL